MVITIVKNTGIDLDVVEENSWIVIDYWLKKNVDLFIIFINTIFLVIHDF